MSLLGVCVVLALIEYLSYKGFYFLFFPKNLLLFPMVLSRMKSAFYSDFQKCFCCSM